MELGLFGIATQNQYIDCIKLVVCARFFMTAMRCRLVRDSLNEVDGHDSMAVGAGVDNRS
jgi:hypothetical protein